MWRARVLAAGLALPVAGLAICDCSSEETSESQTGTAATGGGAGVGGSSAAGGGGGGGAPSGQAEVFAGLIIHPEHPHYFEYNGKPFVSFIRFGNYTVPVPSDFDEQVVQGIGYDASHVYLAAHHCWVRCTWQMLYDELQNDAVWQHVGDISKWAFDNDVMLSILFWSYKYRFDPAIIDEEGYSWVGSNMIYPVGDPAWDEVVVQDGDGNDVTKLDLHRLAIEKAIAATWSYPNVTYNLMWEYDVRTDDADKEGTFHRWWVNQMKAEGATVDPDVEHLFSIVYCGEHPSERHADFIVEEDGNGFWERCDGPDQAKSYQVPLVLWSADHWYEQEHGINGDEIPLTWQDVRAILQQGFHPAQTWVDLTPEAKKYYLQARWHVENHDFDTTALPDYHDSQRPTLHNPEGYVNGARHDGEVLEFAAVYADPDGDPPSLAMLWADLDGNGRFTSDEKLTMEATSDEYQSGVVYSVGSVQPTVGSVEKLYYAFRFADQHGYPPEPTELATDHWYGHWEVDVPER